MMITKHTILAPGKIPPRTVKNLKQPVPTAETDGTIGRFNHGSALIGLVAAIVLLSVIAAAIVPMVGSSGQQAGLVDQASKAYLMAESAYHLAASRFLHAGANSIDQHQMLEQLDGNYTLDNNQGRFELELYAYFYEIVDDSLSGATSVKAHCPGTFPGPGVFPDDADDEVALSAGLKVSIQDQTYTLDIGSDAVNGEDDNVTFVFDGPLPFVAKGAVIYPVAIADESQTPTLTNGGDLAYNNDSARMFPLRNGKILVDDLTLTYRFNDRINDRFVDIQNPNQPGMIHTLSSDAEIKLARYVRVHATGVYGDDEMGARRRVVYYTPLPLEDSGTRKVSFTDRFDTDADFTGATGSHAIGDVAGDSALKVEGTVTVGDDKGSLIQFDPTTEAGLKISFGAARRATRGYLNYDAQIKVGYEALPQPTLSYLPYRPIPAHVATGLSFRLSGTDTGDATFEDLFESNAYGISFLRGNSSLNSAIPDEIIPVPDTRMIVLWQQTANGSDRNWLAYKELPVVVDWSDDFEGAVTWEKDPLSPRNLWNTSSQPDSPHSGSVAWHFGREASPGVYTYQPPPPFDNLASLGGLRSQAINLCNAPSVTLTFWSWHRTEEEYMFRDQKQVRILIDGSEHKRHNIARDGDQQFWYQEQVDLTEFSGDTIQIEFYFDSIDGDENNFSGWMVDDVQILCEDWPLQNATLSVRLREALVVRFYEGQAEIKEGDRIQGGLRNTTGTVIEPPLLSSGTWGGTPAAAGTLLLNRTNIISTGDAFQADEPIVVLGSAGQARVTAWDETNDRKANVIQVFYANENGFGDGDTDPLNRITRPYGRLGIDAELTELQHPPTLDGSGNWTDDDGNFTASDDYFRLVQWDEINDANVTGLSRISFFATGHGLVNNGLIQSHYHQSDSDTLQTPDFPAIFEEPELGLHTYGDGSENVYFDDFGIVLNVGQDDILLPPLQQ
jgi:type II secretory pathway pseudopilin PulG